MEKIRYYSLWLVLICFIVFAGQILYPPLTDKYALISSQVLQRPWILLTSIFLHGSASHILYNMFALALFGFILEKIIGSKRFLILFFSSGLFASIGAAIFYNATIGASGAIMGILGTLAVLRPKMTVFVGMIPMPMAAAAAFWALGDFIKLFAPTQVASAAHLFGLAFGIAFGFYLRKEYGLVFKKKHSRAEDKEFEKEFEEWEKDWM